MAYLCKFSDNKQKGTEQAPLCINVDITENIFTPFACASVVNEFIKSLVYQKSQIPYPYNWLKTVVNRKRKSCEGDERKKPINLNIDRHYRVVSTAYDNLEEIMKNIRKELDSSCEVHEILILFGTTPQCPKEAYTIKVPSIDRSHLEENHVQDISKNQQKILRGIFLSEIWLSAAQSSICNTNMYVLVKKTCLTEELTKDSFFLPNFKYNLPSRVKNIIVNLKCDDTNVTNCCKNLLVFNDDIEGCDSGASNYKIEKDNSTEDVKWYQAKLLVTGFKDCFVNKVSASELW